MNKEEYRKAVVEGLKDIAGSVSYIAAHLAENKFNSTKETKKDSFNFFDDVDPKVVADAVKLAGRWLKK